LLESAKGCGIASPCDLRDRLHPSSFASRLGGGDGRFGSSRLFSGGADKRDDNNVSLGTFDNQQMALGFSYGTGIYKDKLFWGATGKYINMTLDTFSQTGFTVDTGLFYKPMKNLTLGANLQTDVNNCGGCGNVCAAGQICAQAACIDNCGPVSPCGEGCADLRNDFWNCGVCGTACTLGQACVDATCVDIATFISTMDGAFANCGTSYADINSDRTYCGQCGNECTPAQVCANGVCSTACEGTLTACPPVGCVDTQTSETNCGSCGSVCQPGDVCLTGVCTPSCGSLANVQLCGSLCANVLGADERFNQRLPLRVLLVERVHGRAADDERRARFVDQDGVDLVDDGKMRRALDVTRAEKEFGFRAETDLESGLRKTIEWYNSQI